MGVAFWIILAIQPANATPAEEGIVLVQLADDSWVLQYNNRRYVCETTPLCIDFREGMQFLPNMNFERKKELVDYLTSDHKLHDCVLRNCRVY